MHHCKGCVPFSHNGMNMATVESYPPADPCTQNEWLMCNCMSVKLDLLAVKVGVKEKQRQ